MRFLYQIPMDKFSGIYGPHEGPVESDAPILRLACEGNIEVETFAGGGKSMMFSTTAEFQCPHPCGKCYVKLVRKED